MDVVNVVCLLVLCLVPGNVANLRNDDIAKLLQRIESLEHQQRKTQSKVHHLEHRINSQYQVIATKAEQIKTLQKEVKEDRKLSEQTKYKVISNTNKINVLQKILRLSTTYIKHHDRNKNSDTSLVKATKMSEASVKPLMEGEQQKGSTKKTIVLPHERSLEKRQGRSGISFSVYIDHDQNLGAQQTIRFNKVIINEGNGYSNSSGVFTCPEAGVYLLTFFVGERSVVSTNRQIYAELVINSANTIDAAVETFHRTQDLQGGNTVIKRLKQGDLVWVASMGTGQHSEGSSNLRISTFSGVFLYP